LWEQSFDVLADSLALSYADPVADGRVLYTTGGSRVRAFDFATGKPLWHSRRLGPVPELHYDQRAIYVQLGGQFYDIKSEKWKWEGGFGAAALDRDTGKMLWRFKDAAGAVTNLLVYADRVWLADADELIALDRRSGAVLTRVEHGLRDRPVYVALNADRRILLVGENEVAAYHEVTGKRLWHNWQKPVRPSLWSRFSGNLLRATGSVLKLGSYVVANVSGLLPAIPSLTLPLGGVSVKLVNTKNLVAQTSGSAGRRFSYQSGSIDEDRGTAYLRGGHQFFITEPKGHDQALAMVNLRNGETERLIALPSDEPNLVIDEGNRRIYQAFGTRLVAIPL
jgi:outer membrane protein assembly factor BamB